MIGIEKQIYSETYLLLVKYYDCQDTYEVWQAIVDDVRKLVKDYDNYKFARDMALLVVEQLEYKICGKTNEKYENKKAEDWNYLIQRYLERKAKQQQQQQNSTNTQTNKETLNNRLARL